MERACYTFELAEGQEEEYLRRHADVWPEMIEALKASGFSNYTLFKRGREIIAYCEAEPTFEDAIAKLEATDVNRRWSAYIRSIMSRSVDDDGRLFTVEQIWHLD